MSSALQKIGNGPWHLRWHTDNGTKPFGLTARVIAILDHKIEYHWQSPRPDLLTSAWSNFLDLRASIAQQVRSLANDRSNDRYASDPFLNLQCQPVSMAEAAADYLRYLPPALVSPEASAYLSQVEIDSCQQAFKELESRVQTYLAVHQQSACSTTLEAAG